jgi:ABC-type transporter Mla MlaB component
MVIIEDCFDNKKVAELWKNKQDIITKETADLVAVKKIDSGGVAFLVFWSKNLNKKLNIRVTEGVLENWIKLFGISQLFNLEIIPKQ